MVMLFYAVLGSVKAKGYRMAEPPAILRQKQGVDALERCHVALLY